MFNLIVTLIAIGLGVVITATTVFYGGDSYSEGSTEALATTYINQAQQVQGGFTLYKAKYGSNAESVDALQTEGYLSSVPTTPSSTTWELATDSNSDEFIAVVETVATSSDDGISAEVCEKINENGGGLVECGTVTASDVSGLTAEDLSSLDDSTVAYDADVTSYAAVVMAR